MSVVVINRGDGFGATVQTSFFLVLQSILQQTKTIY